MNLKRFWLWAAYVVVLAAVTIGGLEFASSFVVPPWPVRELRPVIVEQGERPEALRNLPFPPVTYNSWGLHDRERSLQKPAGINFRSILIGDSFLEGGFVSRPVGARIEEIWASADRRDMEAVSLGVSATGPRQYYYRIKNIALSMEPDAMVLVFFSGNDFVKESLGVRPLIAERPEASWLGDVAPRLTWLIVNRTNLSEFGGGGNINDFDAVNATLQLPRDQRVDAIVRLLKRNHLPDTDEGAIRRIISRAGDTFWAAFEKRDHDQEFLQSWWLSGMVEWENSTWSVPTTPQEFERSVNPAEIQSTMTWLVGAADLARARGVKFLIALAPSPSIDPRYAEFWSPWPRYSSFPKQRIYSGRALRAALDAKKLPVVDLETDFEGMSGTYRLSDGHWTELGTDIAAKRLAAELLKLR